jgi:pyruvate kinase
MGDNKRVMLPHPEIIDACEIGHVLMVDDGKVKLTVTGKGPDYLDCHVDVNGKISNRKVRPAERGNLLKVSQSNMLILVCLSPSFSL